MPLGVLLFPPKLGMIISDARFLWRLGTEAYHKPINQGSTRHGSNQKFGEKSCLFCRTPRRDQPWWHCRTPRRNQSWWYSRTPKRDQLWWHCRTPRRTNPGDTVGPPEEISSDDTVGPPDATDSGDSVEFPEEANPGNTVRPPEGTNPCDTWISDVQLRMLREKVSVFRPPRVRRSVLTALGDYSPLPRGCSHGWHTSGHSCVGWWVNTDEKKK